MQPGSANPIASALASTSSCLCAYGIRSSTPSFSKNHGAFQHVRIVRSGRLRRRAERSQPVARYTASPPTTFVEVFRGSARYVKNHRKKTVVVCLSSEASCAALRPGGVDPVIKLYAKTMFRGPGSALWKFWKQERHHLMYNNLHRCSDSWCFTSGIRVYYASGNIAALTVETGACRSWRVKCC